MIEYVTRFLNMIVAGLLAHAARLTKVAAARHEVAEYTAVLEEADLLEHSAVPAKRQLAKLLRLEVERTIETAFTEAPPPPALNGDANHHPFALTGPTDAAASPPQGREPQRRGRRPSAAKVAQQQAPRDPTVTPAANSEHP
jgi:hypothetical protein